MFCWLDRRPLCIVAVSFVFSPPQAAGGVQRKVEASIHFESREVIIAIGNQWCKCYQLVYNRRELGWGGFELLQFLHADLQIL